MSSQSFRAVPYSVSSSLILDSRDSLRPAHPLNAEAEISKSAPVSAAEAAIAAATAASAAAEARRAFRSSRVIVVVVGGGGGAAAPLLLLRHA